MHVPHQLSPCYMHQRGRGYGPPLQQNTCIFSARWRSDGAPPGKYWPQYYVTHKEVAQKWNYVLLIIHDVPPHKGYHCNNSFGLGSYPHPCSTSTRSVLITYGCLQGGKEWCVFSGESVDHFILLLSRLPICSVYQKDSGMNFCWRVEEAYSRIVTESDRKSSPWVTMGPTGQ